MSLQVDKAVSKALNASGKNGKGARKEVLLLHLRPWQEVGQLATLAAEAGVVVRVSCEEPALREQLVQLLPLLPERLRSV
jgi:hypothetical protein